MQSLFLTVLLPIIPDRGAVTSRDKTLHRFQVAPRRPDLRARALPAAARRARATRRCRALARARDEPDAALAAAAAAAVAPPTLGVDVVCYRAVGAREARRAAAAPAAPRRRDPRRAPPRVRSVRGGRRGKEVDGTSGASRHHHRHHVPRSSSLATTRAHRGVRMIGPVYFAERSDRLVGGGPRNNLPSPPPLPTRDSASSSRCSRPTAQRRPAS